MINRDITAEDFKQAVKQMNIKRWSPLNCSICGSPLYFVFEENGEVVRFEDRCKCVFQVNSTNTLSSYEEIKQHYDELDDEDKLKMLNDFSIVRGFSTDLKKEYDFLTNDFIDNIRKQYTEEYLRDLKKKSYEEDRNYPENFSNWYSAILDFGRFKSAKIISNQILSFEDVCCIEKTDLFREVNWGELRYILKPTLDLMESNKLYSIKNGCFSDKFDFDVSLADKDNLAEQFWKLNYDSHMFETGGYTELVVREMIPHSNPIDNPTIYNGLPLREEIRVFYNIDTSCIEYMVDYWDYDYCYEHISKISDKVVFNWFHNKFDSNRDINHNQKILELYDKIRDYIDSLKFDKHKISGIWSIDFLWEKYSDDIYLIDMARGFRSAYWDTNKLSKQTKVRLESGA